MTIGPVCILHPKCTVIALAGPIILGQGNIVEEMAVIVNRRPETLVVGENNLFEAGCRKTLSSLFFRSVSNNQSPGIEAVSIGSHNTFEAKSRIPASIAIADWCHIGATCTVVPDAIFPSAPDTTKYSQDKGEAVDKDAPYQTLPPKSVIYGSECHKRMWRGEGMNQAKALHIKHLEYLREVRCSQMFRDTFEIKQQQIIPKYARLKMIAPPTI